MTNKNILEGVNEIAESLVDLSEELIEELRHDGANESILEARIEAASCLEDGTFNHDRFYAIKELVYKWYDDKGIVRW